MQRLTNNPFRHDLIYRTGEFVVAGRKKHRRKRSKIELDLAGRGVLGTRDYYHGLFYKFRVNESLVGRVLFCNTRDVARRASANRPAGVTELKRRPVYYLFTGKMIKPRRTIETKHA